MTAKAAAVRAVSQQFRDRMNAVIEGVMAHLRDDNAKEILGPGLSPLVGRGSLRAIVTLALYADVLRVVRDMMVKDGAISDEEIEASSDLLSALAEAFAKARNKDYGSYAVLSSENARPFLTQYENDAGLFGYLNEGTRWGGRHICCHLAEKYKDSSPLFLFGTTLLEWAQAIAASDDTSQSEQSHLQSLADFLNIPHNPGHSQGEATKGRGTESSKPVVDTGHDYSTSPDWYYSSNGKKIGPVSESEIRILATLGELSGPDLVWQAGTPNWIPAASVPGLFSEPPPLPPTGLPNVLAAGYWKWKVHGIIGIALLLVFVLLQSIITSHNRQRQAALDFQTNELRATLGRVTDMFNALPINNDVDKISRELSTAAGIVLTYNRINSTVPKMFWLNTIDAAMGGRDAVNRSMVLEKFGTVGYLSTLGSGGSKNLESFMFEFARQLADEGAVTCKPIATHFWELCNHKIKTGASKRDVIDYAMDEFRVPEIDELHVQTIAEVIARSNSETQETIIKQESRSDLDAREKQKIIDSIIIREAERQLFLRFGR